MNNTRKHMYTSRHFYSPKNNKNTKRMIIMIQIQKENGTRIKTVDN